MNANGRPKIGRSGDEQSLHLEATLPDRMSAGNMDGMLNSTEEVVIRAMRESDLSAVLAIEQAGRGMPWTRAHFESELANGAISKPLIAEFDERVVGFAVAWFIAGEIQLINLGVLPEARRRGVATQLLDWLIEKGTRLGYLRIELEVRSSNEPAIRLYQKLGFSRSGVRRNYYPNNDEDAILMTKHLQSGDTADALK